MVDFPRMFRETHVRSVAKALSWRLLGTLATTALVFVFTRRLALSLAVGGLEFASKIALFWFHERAWERIRYGREEVAPAVVWLTGLSGAGKSAIARDVFEGLRRRGYRAELLDGDALRELFPSTGFEREARDEHVRRAGHLAGRLERQGVFVVAAFVSPFREARGFARAQCRNFIEVWVSTPLEECERRDRTGLYARARAGAARNVAGLDDPYEPPERPELVVDTAQLPAPEAAALVLAEVGRRLGRR